MKLISKMLVGAALVSATFGAQAVTVTPTSFSTFNLGVLTSGQHLFDHYMSAATDFTDTYNFSLTSTSKADIATSASNFSFLSYNVEISNLAMKLYDSSNAVVGSGLNFSVASLAAGDYHMQATGTVLGNAGGLYHGAISVSPVPEAETYSMMLAGLGLMGFIVRRRRAD